MITWFMGTGFFASHCLRSLVQAGLSPDLVVTMPPRPSGRRGMSESPTLVESTASDLSLNLHRSSKVNSDTYLLDRMKNETPDCIFVVDFGQKVGEPYLSTPRGGCLNVHPSLLPLYRGAAPVQRAIMEGQSDTGVTVFRLVEEMDAGPVVIQERASIEENETSGELLFRLAYIGGVLLFRGVQLILDKENPLQPQNSLIATYAPKIDKKEALLSWNLSARSIHCKVRALNPSPGAYLYIQGCRVKIWSTEVVDVIQGSSGVLSIDDSGFPVVKCSSGAVRLLEVQPEGKKRLSGVEWVRGSQLSEGEILS
ncbi:methionyl-tRNA formyltransferase [Dethiosulfovibrio salsuginis]|uniref:Methionyl-tRNA formyltransferase n=1 Tax=Dethiosulfovibrio salsuginis TaxID=561720 RepID=A0A1X7I206_9BACT|nr:methionyl-tRNA formyltransferase [Dethiosulfovibrio salsuginis]SMG08442.1 methionyl-tRNA formyltransferase [Dethiosulfovibrio salsuginis]